MSDLATMSPREVTSALKAIIPTGLPVFLWGAPGVGKSQITHQVATDLGRSLIDVRAVLLDPVDLRGLPHVSHGKAAWAIPDFLPVAERDGAAGVLFLDELNAAPQLRRSPVGPGRLLPVGPGSPPG